ncbi:hypothetical protein ACH4XT_37235 [Streptomyces avidinii]|uniref:hypothetical protein n=1 Tax=Streptomyces avidinii TaxID=1895 RepID=UPI0037BDFA73
MISTRRPPGRHRHHLGGRASRFTALVGIDDFSTKQSPPGPSAPWFARTAGPC